MIYFDFSIGWSVYKDEQQKDYFVWCKSLSENKQLEIQLSKSQYRFHLFGIIFNWTTNTDHAGVMVELAFLQYFFEVNFCDKRHWNRNERRFYLPGEEVNE